MFEKGKIYHRQSELHDKYGGNRQSGIAPCANEDMIFLFTSPAGKEHGYEDSWIDEKTFRYTGEGQYGNMELIRGNLAIKNHREKGKRLFLFEKVNSGYYKFIGEFKYCNHINTKGIDSDEQTRQIIVFDLKLI